MKSLNGLVFAATMVPNLGLAVCIDGHYSVSDEVNTSNLIFTAKVQEAHPVIDKEEDFIEGHIYILVVTKFYKGSDIPIAVTYSENTSGRFDMELDQEYLLFTDDFRNPMTIDNCGNSGGLAESQSVLQELRGLLK